MQRRLIAIFGICALFIVCLAAPSLAATHPVSQASPDLTPSGPTGGPPWTFQMARIAIVLMVLAAAGVALAYRRFVMRPERRLRDERRRDRAGERNVSEGASPTRN